MRRTIRVVAFVAVLVLVAAAVLSSVVWWPALRFELDVARLEILVLAVFGGPAALVAGRAAYRTALAASILIVTMAVQLTTALIIFSEGPQCGSVISDVSIAIAFWPLILRSMPIVVAGIVIVAPAFAYVVLSRRPLLVRMGAVAALLLAVAACPAVLAQLHPGPTHCIDF